MQRGKLGRAAILAARGLLYEVHIVHVPNPLLQVINFGLLKKYGAKYDFVLIYPKSWSEGVGTTCSSVPPNVL